MGADLSFRSGKHVLHPFIRIAKKRRRKFQSREAMFDNYRQKSVFKRLSDDSLYDYVEALACPNPEGEFELCYSPEWEAQIYRNWYVRS